MDDYLTGRRSDEDYKPGFFESIKESFRRQEKVEVINPKEESSQEEFKEEEDFENQMNDEPVTAPKRSLISWLFRFKRKPKITEEDFDEVEIQEETPDVDLESCREAIKILHKWVEKLDPDTLNRFKRSEDFEKYKEALKNLKMIK